MSEHEQSGERPLDNGHVAIHDPAIVEDHGVYYILSLIHI